jgi:hypothetical protein
MTTAGNIMTDSRLGNQDKLEIGKIEVFYFDTPANITALDYAVAACSIKTGKLECDDLGSTAFQVLDGFLYLGFGQQGPPYIPVELKVVPAKW